MERLTIRNNVGRDVLKSPVVCGRCGEIDYSPITESGEDIAKHLAAYEETGLEPDLVQFLAKLYSNPSPNCLADRRELALYRALGTVEELAALVEARAERRLVVLPCAPSDVTVYQLRSKRHALGVGISARHISAATVWANGDFILHHQGADGCCEKDFGKTWFLNYAEAEAALPGGGNDDDP